MHDPLQRLYRTKLTLLATILTVVGLALLIAAHWLRTVPSASWANNLPISDIGSALFTTGLITVPSVMSTAATAKNELTSASTESSRPKRRPSATP